MACLVAACSIAAAQDQIAAPPTADPQAQPQTQSPADSGWRKFSPAQDPAQAPAQAPSQVTAKPDPSEPVDRSGEEPAKTAPQTTAPPVAAPQTMPQVPAPQPMAAPAPGASAPQANRPPAYGLPPQLTAKQGTYVSLRINQMLNSNRNVTGDGFSGALTQPLVVNGIVVAPRGAAVYGRVAKAEKSSSGHPSVLALQLTGITLADGAQAPVESQMVSWEGGKTPAGVQAGTVIGTTAVGAGIGGAVGWGTGAAVGAGAGLAVGAIAALVTHNHPTIIYPETAMTFRLDAALTVNTSQTPQAWRYVSPNDYNRAPLQTRVGPGPGPAPYGSYYGPYAGPYPYPYPYGYYPYWGPYFGVGIGMGRFGRWR